MCPASALRQPSTTSHQFDLLHEAGVDAVLDPADVLDIVGIFRQHGQNDALPSLLILPATPARTKRNIITLGLDIVERNII